MELSITETHFLYTLSILALLNMFKMHVSSELKLGAVKF